MPNRLIRDGILKSDRVNAIASKPGAEVFYRRLMSVVDDYGRYDARPALLRAALYPLRLDIVSDMEVSEYLASCEAARLVKTYIVDGKPYLELLDFDQRLRAKRSKFPAPDGQMADTCPPSAGRRLAQDCELLTDDTKSRSSAVMGRPEAESESESEVEVESESRSRSARETASLGLKTFLAAYPKQTKQDATARAYESTIHGEDGEHQRLMAGLERWRASHQWVRSLKSDGGQYVPDPDRFILEKRYLETPGPYRGERSNESVHDRGLELWRPTKEAA